MKRKVPLLVGQINSSDSSGEVSYRLGLAAKGKGREVDDGRRGQNVSVVSGEAGVEAKEASPEEMPSFYYEEVPGSGLKGVDRDRASSKSGERINPITPAAALHDSKAELEEVEVRQGLILYTVLLHRQLQDLADQINLYRAMDSLFDGCEHAENCILRGTVLRELTASSTKVQRLLRMGISLHTPSSACTECNTQRRAKSSWAGGVGAK